MRSRDNAPLSRYLDPFLLDRDWGTSNGERRHAVVASGSVLLPLDITLGAVWTMRSQSPWSATAGREVDLRRGTEADGLAGAKVEQVDP